MLCRYDDQGCQLDVKAHRRDGGGASTSYQRVLSVMGVVWHGDVQGALDIDLATRIEEEPGIGASRQRLISAQFLCSIACA